MVVSYKKKCAKSCTSELEYLEIMMDNMQKSAPNIYLNLSSMIFIWYIRSKLGLVS
ncbi:protein of unknown function [Maridesulfovibrio hydrothermalis AM13 = DSM 14728]|uniref:Uncharacterized protein n=1 Tax=Maridesulfovibrio hydrothermalis AM13 = DSM 14728 TaxID=1121451 RepID=L0RBT5_9BACT|nr:protein of unknown function [Maridesulfovibrio hydrothermalis AM13 = DSM 14728]